MGEAEAWLRRELAFLHRVERRIVRRERWRKEAWRAVTVAAILAVFALCWYLAALATHSAADSACTGKAGTTVSAHAATGKTTAGSATAKTGSGSAASCGS
jgi:hypothetical protein